MSVVLFLASRDGGREGPLKLKRNNGVGSVQLVQLWRFGILLFMPFLRGVYVASVDSSTAFASGFDRLGEENAAANSHQGHYDGYIRIMNTV